MKKYFQISEVLSFFIQLFITLALLTVCGIATGCLMPDKSMEIYAKCVPLFPESLRSVLAPEPVEKTVFTLLYLLLIPLALATLYICRLHGRKYHEHPSLQSKAKWRKLLWAGCILLFSLTIWCFVGIMDFLEVIFKPLVSYPWSWLPCGLTAIALAVMMIKLKLYPKQLRKWWPLAIFPLLMLVIFNRMYYLGWVPPNTYHLEILVYAVSHAAQGQLEWHLYGNYHWILSPLFVLIKPSIFNFSLVMNILFIFTFMTMFFLGSRLIKNYILLFLMVFFMIFLNCSSTIYQHYIEPYFQYHPIRSFWPAVAMLIFYFYHTSKGRLKYVLLAAICCALSLFWNIDSGIAVTGVFVFFFGAETASAGFRRDKLMHLAWFGSVFIISLLALYGACCWSFGRILPPDYFLQGYLLILRTGFWSLPMPLWPCMWVFFAGIYVAAVIAGLRGMFSGHKTLFSQSCLFLGVLGLGQFSYYLNRSHVCNLWVAISPATLLMFCFADRCLRMSKNDRKLIALALPALPVILLGVGALFIFGYNSKFIINGTIMQLSFLTVDDSKSQFRQRIDFILKSAGARKKINIIGDYQGIYYAESGLTSGIPNFNEQEIFTVRQQEICAKQLAESDCPLILASPGIRFYYIRDETLKFYKLIAESDDGELKYYEPLKNLQKNKNEGDNTPKNSSAQNDSRLLLFEEISR